MLKNIAIFKSIYAGCAHCDQQKKEKVIRKKGKMKKKYQKNIFW